MIALEGSIQTRSYEDRQGNKRTAFEVVVDQAHFCGSKNEASNQNSADANIDFDIFEEISPDDSLPF